MATIEKRITDLERQYGKPIMSEEEADRLILKYGGDPNMPLEEMIAEIKRLKQEIHVERIGIRTVQTGRNNEDIHQD
jgi:hypothetical protein